MSIQAVLTPKRRLIRPAGNVLVFTEWLAPSALINLGSDNPGALPQGAMRMQLRRDDSNKASIRRATPAPPHFGASEATIFSKRGSPRSGSQKGNSFRYP